MGLLTMHPAESALKTMPFTGVLETGETITAVTSVVANTPAGALALVIGSPTFSTTAVQVRISGGTTGVTYRVTFTVTTSASNTRVEWGDLLWDGG